MGTVIAFSCTVPDDATADSTSTGLSSANQCWTCNEGYDDHNDDGTCSVTDAGHYSPAGNSDRISCTIPDDATADSASTGLSSANQCWTCNEGYDDHNDDGTCSVTDAGHYSPDGNSDRISCSTVTAPDDATADSASTGLSSANQCWTCNAGYDDHNDDGTCSVTGAGHYSPAGNSDRISCNTVTDPDDATADSASTGLSSANQCWTCNAGYDDHNDNTCEETEEGYYSAGNDKTRTQCSTDGTKNQPIPEDASWQGTGLVSAVACRWTCNSGHHISSDSTSCTINDCSSEINDGNGERTSHSGACQVTSCEAGFYEKTTGTCSEVEAVSGKYSPANNKGTTACTNTVTKPGTATWTNPIKSDDVGDCTWTCNGGGYTRHLNACYVDTRVCNITDTTTNKVGEGSQSYQPGTVGAYTTCQVTSCIAGYHKDPNTEACIQVGANLGKYSPVDDATLYDCSAKTANSDWVMTAGASQSSECNWDCDGDYTEDDRACHETTVGCDIMSGGTGSTKIGTGTKTYQSSTDNYSACGSATDCETGYVLKNGGCHVPCATRCLLIGG